MTAIMMWKKNRNVVADDEYINLSMTFTPIILAMILSNKEIREQYYNQYFVIFIPIYSWSNWFILFKDLPLKIFVHDRYQKFNEIQRRYFLI